MASAKTATPTFRIEPELKEAVRVASFNEHRSIAKMIAVSVEIAAPDALAIDS